MTKYEAETSKVYFSAGCLITAKAKIASAIDDSWIYSMHWKDDTWVDQARDACINRIDSLRWELSQLESAMELIKSIEPIEEA